MAQFPMGGFFNRQRHNNHNHRQFGQFGQMPRHAMPPGNMRGPMPMPGFGQGFGPHNQNVPRGTFPPNFNSPPQHNMPQAPMQQMPPMHLLNPTNDPNVRFEPIPSGLAPPGAAPNPSPGQQGQSQPQLSAPAANNAGELATGLSDLIQGESNSIIFYEKLAKSSGISENNKQLVEELIGNKKRLVQNISKLYSGLFSGEWRAREVKIEETRNFRADIAYSLLQESKLLREASQIYAKLEDPSHQGLMNAVLYSKVADIAHLMAI